MITHQYAAPHLPARVLVLGASGFIGRSLVPHLRACGIEILPLSSGDVDLCAPEAVVTIRSLLRTDDALVILSAITPDKRRDIATLMRNLAMIAHISGALEALPCSHLIYLSSDAVYDEGANPVCETTRCHPSTLHGLMHVTREQMLTHTSEKLGIPLLRLRSCAIYGPHDPHDSYGPNRFLRTAREKRVITLIGKGEEKRDHVYLKDVSRVIGMCLLHKSAGTLNVATGTSTSFVDVAQMVVRLVAGDVQIEWLPRTNRITHRHMDIAATIRAFPLLSFTPLREGLAETAGAVETAGLR